MRHPYILGGVARGSGFYGRQETVQELLDPSHAQVYLVGNRRIGKTSLLRYLELHTTELALYINLSGSDSDSTWLAKNARRAIERQLIRYPLYKEALTGVLHDSPDDLGGLVELLGLAADQGQFNILLLLDEAEGLLGLEENILARLDNAIKGQERVRTILAATRELAELYTRETASKISPFLQGFQIVYLPPLTDEESGDLICQISNGVPGVQADEKLIKQICTATGNHPYLLQVLCARLFYDGRLHSINNKKNLRLELDLQNYCRIEHAVLSPSERIILSWLAQKGALDCQALAQLCKLPVEIVEDFLFILELLGTVRVRKKLYQVSNVFMKHWLLIEALKKDPDLVSDQVSQEIADQAQYQDFDESDGLGSEAEENQKVSDLASREVTNQTRLQGFKTSLVRLLDKDKNPVGAGFLVDSKRVLTCAHVVAAALDLDEIPNKMPEDKICLDFPLLEPGRIIEVCTVGWQPPVGQDRGDIALLELCSTRPEEASPAKLVNSNECLDYPFRVFGFPANHNSGVWVKGQVTGAITGGRVQIEAVSQTGYFIQPGFSGGPVWAEKLNGIVGMVVAVESSPEIRVAYMIPYELFAALIDTPMLDDTKQV